jgi:hypothetical protein
MNGRERGRRLVEQIYAAYEESQETRRANRVRPSELGNECTRALWYQFRWADKLERFSGRMLRLFETGHSQEARMLADLRRVGADVLDRDPADSTKQIGLEDLGGHMKGYVDGMSTKLPHAVEEWAPTECKTHSAKSFKAIEKDGVEIAKPTHYAQMQIYMHKMGLAEALYIAVNKDTDDVYAEYVDYNPSYAERLMRKAQQIVWSAKAPERIHNNPSFFKCRVCKSTGVCHSGELPERNCRTCMDAKPIEGGAWACGVHGTELSLDDQRAGCSEHRYNPELVLGEQVDVREVAGVHHVVYKRPDGSEYVDAGANAETKDPALT